MGMSDYKKARELIRESEEDTDFEGPRSEELVQKAERALGLEFPPTYRRFLREFGAGDVGGEEFYGIINDQWEKSSVPDAIWCTLTARRKLGLPADLVVVGDTGDGEFYCLQILPDGTDGPIVTFGPERKVGDKVASDFGKFFRERVEEVVED